MAPLIGNIPLNQLALPGTHDSGTYVLNPLRPSPDNSLVIQILYLVGAAVVVPWSTAQDLDLGQQLTAGVRYLDLRVCADQSGGLSFCHAFFGPPVSVAFDAVNAFLAANPQEVVILDFNHFYAMNGEAHDRLALAIETQFGNKLIPKTTNVSSTTLNDLWQGPGRLIVLYRNEGDATPILPNNNNLWPGDQIVSAWPEAAGWDTLNARVAVHAECRCDVVHGGGDPFGTKLFVLQTQATPNIEYILGQTANIISGERGLWELAAHRDLVHNVWDLAQRFPWFGGFPVHGASNIFISDYFERTNFVEMVKALNARNNTPATLLRTWMNDSRLMWTESPTSTFFGHRNAAQVSSIEGPERTAHAAAVAGLDGRVVAAWMEAGRLNAISWANGQFFNRVHVSDQLGLEDTGPPAMTTFNGRVWMAWIAEDNHIAFLSSADGVNWSRGITHARNIDSIPALAVHNGRMYIAYQGDGNQLTVMSSANGVDWTPPLELGVYSTVGPGLASFNGRLRLAWGDDAQLMLWSTADGFNFDSRIRLPEQVARNPALTLFRGRLALGWIGTDDRPNVMFSADGLTFNDKITDLGVDAGGHDLRAAGLSLLALPLPTLTATVTTRDGPPYAPGTWSNQPVKVSFTCVSGAGDVLSIEGGASAGGSGETILYEGTYAGITGHCGDATALHVGPIYVDVSPPHITAVATTDGGAPYVAGTSTPQNVTVRFECDDALSGVVSVDGPVRFTNEGNDQFATGRCTDRAGNTAIATFSPVWIFRPPLYIEIKAFGDNGNRYALGSWARLVNVTFVCVAQFGVHIQNPGFATFNTEGTNQQTTSTCFNQDGSIAATTTFGPVNIDRTPPVVQAQTVTADGVPYVPGTPTSRNVIVSFSCQDALSGVATVNAPVTITTEGRGQGVRGFCTDNAGNLGWADVTDIWIAKAPPVITATAARAAGQLYTPGSWSRVPVTVSFACDTASGVSALTGSVVLGEGAMQSSTGVCVDRAGNSASVTFGPVNVDLTAPKVPCVSPSGQWSAVDVALGCSASDSLSGLAQPGGAQFTLGTAVASGTEDSNASTNSRIVCDVAGNCVSVGPIAGNKVDKKTPVIVATRNPPANANGWNNTLVVATFVASDGGSGVAGAARVTVPFTSEGANQSAARTFTDNVGNAASAAIGSINIDTTPPQAFNQFDPTTKNVLVIGRDQLSGVPAGPIAPISAKPARWTADDDGDKDDGHGGHEDRKPSAQLRTYLIADRAGNTLQVVELVSIQGHHVKVRVVSIQYNGGPVVRAGRNEERFEWETDKNGVLRELVQMVDVGTRSNRRRVQAEWNAKKNQTVIHISDESEHSDAGGEKGRKKEEHGEHDTKIVKPGMVLLRMAVVDSTVVVEY